VTAATIFRVEITYTVKTEAKFPTKMLYQCKRMRGFTSSRNTTTWIFTAVKTKLCWFYSRGSRHNRQCKGVSLSSWQQ